ncbi:hypothetical protein [Eoetvoesiella caeni]
MTAKRNFFKMEQSAEGGLAIWAHSCQPAQGAYTAPILLFPF